MCHPDTKTPGPNGAWTGDLLHRKRELYQCATLLHDDDDDDDDDDKDDDVDDDDDGFSFPITLPLLFDIERKLFKAETISLWYKLSYTCIKS